MSGQNNYGAFTQWRTTRPSLLGLLTKPSVEYYLAIRKKRNLPFTTAWMDLENIILSEISQSEKDKRHMTSLHTELPSKIETDS